MATRVETVYKSPDTEFFILSVLKSHFYSADCRNTSCVRWTACLTSMLRQERTLLQKVRVRQIYIMEEGEGGLVKGKMVATLPSGVSFGDLVLMYNCPRAATIRAKKDCTLWILEKQFFRQAMVTSSSNQTVNLSQFRAN